MKKNLCFICIVLLVFAYAAIAQSISQVDQYQRNLQYVMEHKANGTLDINDPAYQSLLQEGLRNFQPGVDSPDQGADACPATHISSLPYTDTGTTAGMNNDYTECGYYAPDVIYEFTATQSGYHEISLCGSYYDTKLEVRTGGACPGTTQIDCNDDYCGLQSYLSLNLTAGTQYFVIVDGYSSYAGDYLLEITPPPPPPPPPPYCGPIDMVFVIDITGSMGDAIANVAAGLPTIITYANQASGMDLRLGLVTFRDDVIVDHNLTTDTVAVQTSIAGLYASGGWDEPEASDESLREVITQDALCVTGQQFTTNFRPFVLKIIVLVTDARPGGCDDYFDTAVDPVNAHQRALDAAALGIRISSVFVPTWGDPTGWITTIMQDYANTTAGSYYQTAANGSGTANAINQILANCGQGDLQLSAVVSTLTCDNGVVVPDPFNVVVTVSNQGTAACNDLVLSIGNGSGPGGTATIVGSNTVTHASLAAGESWIVSFQADLTADPLGGCVYFNANLTSSTCPGNFLDNICANVPPCTGGCSHVYPGDDCTQPYVIVEPSCCWSATFDLCNYCDDYDLSPCTYEPSAAPDMVFEVTLNSPDPLDPPDLYVLVNPVGNWDPSLVVMTDCGDFMTCICGEDANGAGWPEVCSFSNLANGTYYIIVSGWMSQCGVFQICVNSDWPLPVELESFTAVEGNREIELSWTTASETNNDHFYLIRGLDNRNFTRISNDIPATNSPTGSTYSYLDRYLSNGTTYYYKLVDVDINGIPEVNEMVVTVTPSANAVIVPDDYALRQNYPNPFNPTTQISYDIREAGFVTLTVFDILGREIATLVNAQQSAASYTVEFDASDLSSGIYFYQLKVNDYNNLKKMVILK